MLANPLYSKGSAMDGAEIVMSKMTKQATRIAIRADTRPQRLSLLLLVAFGVPCLAIVNVSRMCRAGEILIAGALILLGRCVASGHHCMRWLPAATPEGLSEQVETTAAWGRRERARRNCGPCRLPRDLKAGISPGFDWIQR